MDLYAKYIDLGYSAVSNLTQQGSLPFTYNGFKTTFNSLVIDNVCKNYLNAAFSVSCDDNLLNSGLDTISIHIMENTRKTLNGFEPISYDLAKSLLNDVQTISTGREDCNC